MHDLLLRLASFRSARILSHSRQALDLLAVLWLACVALAARSQAQTPSADYFQQRVDYDINATLLPEQHTVQATAIITYHNNASTALDSLALHLWANAYSDRESPYAQQMRRYGSTRFAFAEDGDLGGYKELSFIDGIQGAPRYENPELVWVSLSSPVAPGDSAVLKLRFELRVPKSFSRLGRTGKAYQLTQWYPKLALYDREGWHTMPYLDFGEYFNDFGDYRVQLTVPTNGIVAATGILTNPRGINAREERIAQTELNPSALDSLAYAAGSVSYTYVADDVTDFAWFVNPRFRIGVDTARLRGGAVPTYAYYTDKRADLWNLAPRLLARAVRFGDSLVGPYAHPQMTAVSAPLGVGGGMEYPSITVIGGVSDTASLDVVLAHEAYHNWFQGHLASNERKHPWMDEGLTSWLEQRYVRHFRGESGSLAGSLPNFIAKGTSYTQNSALAAFFGATKRNPPADTHSDSVGQIQYGYTAYAMPALLFDMQERALPPGVFEERVRAYYQDWGGRHPSPATLFEYLQSEGETWLEQLITTSERPDYALREVATRGDSVVVTVENRGTVASPFPIAFERADGTVTEEIWLEGFGAVAGRASDARRAYTLAVPSDARRVAIDPNAATPEVKRGDNYYRLTGGPLPRLEPLTVNLLTHAGQIGKTDLNLVPVLGFTRADQLMLGVGVHNYTLDAGGTRFYVLPEVSFRDASLNGLAGLKHSLYARDTWWRELEFSATGRQFHFNYNDTYDYNDRFHRGTLGATLFLRKPFRSVIDNRIGLRGHFVALRYAVGRDVETRDFEERREGYSIVEADFTHRVSDPLRPLQVEFAAQGGQGFARLSSTLQLGLRYAPGERFVRLRGFAGGFLRHEQPEVPAFLLPAGIAGFFNRPYDYTFEETLITRSRASESNQHFVRDGSLSIPYLLPVPFSDSWLASASVSADAPVRLPGLVLRGYLDAAVYPDTRLGASGAVVPVTGGVRLAVVGDMLSVSLPLYNNGFVRESTVFTQVDARYRDRITFRIDLTPANIDNLLRRFRG